MPEECVTEEKNSKKSSLTLMTAQGSDQHIGQVMDCMRFSSLRCLLSTTKTVLQFCKILSSKIHPHKSPDHHNLYALAEPMWIIESHEP